MAPLCGRPRRSASLRRRPRRERAYFNENGFVRPRQILPPDWVDYLVESLEAIYESHLTTEVRPIGVLSEILEGMGGKVERDLEEATGHYYFKNNPSCVSSAPNSRLNHRRALSRGISINPARQTSISISCLGGNPSLELERPFTRTSPTSMFRRRTRSRKPRALWAR